MKPIPQFRESTRYRQSSARQPVQPGWPEGPIGRRNVVWGWVGICTGAISGLIIGGWSFGGVVPPPPGFENYGDLARRMVRLAHVAMFMLPIINILIGKELDGLALSDTWKRRTSTLAIVGMIGIPVGLLLGALIHPYLQHVLGLPACCLLAALALVAYGKLKQKQAPSIGVIERLSLIPCRRPGLALLLVAGLTVLFALFLPRLRIDSTMEAIFLQDEERELYEEYKRTFGDDEIVVVGLKTPEGDVFNPATLRKIDRITQAIEDLPAELGVDRVVSLTNVEDIRSSGPDEFEVVDLIPEEIPEDAAALEAIRKQTFENPLFIHNVVSKDGRAAAITIWLQDRPEDQTFKEDLCQQVRLLVESERGPEEVHLAGIPVLTHYTGQFLRVDMALFIPATILIILFVLWLTFRSLAGVLLPMATVGLSVLWTLGFAALCGKSISILSSIVPSLLIAMGCAYAIHVVNEYYHSSTSGEAKPLEATMRHAFLPVLLAGFTTVIGFAALATNDVAIIRDFGVIAAFGIAAATILTLVGVPAALHYLQPEGAPAAKAENPVRSLLLQLVRWFAVFDARYPKSIVVVSLALVGLGVWGITRIHVDTDYASNFHEDSEPVQALRFMRDNLSGERPIVLTVKHPDKLAIDPAVLARVEEIEALVVAHPLVGSEVSLADYLRRMNQGMHDGDPKQFVNPDSVELSSQYLLLYSRPEEIGRFLSYDETSTAVVGRSSIISSEEFLAFMDALRAELLLRFPELEVKITGSMYLLSKASQVIAVGQAKSLGLATVLIFFVMFFLFRSVKFGLLAMLPNLVPILANFALMGALGVTLNTGTSVMAALALGIAVDDTIHILARYRALRGTMPCHDAIRGTLESAGLAIATTSVTNVLGFMALTLSSFAPLVALGWLTAVTMLTALMADLVLLPALLLIFDRGEVKPPTAGPVGAVEVE